MELGSERASFVQAIASLPPPPLVDPISNPDLSRSLRPLLLENGLPSCHYLSHFRTATDLFMRDLEGRGEELERFFREAGPVVERMRQPIQPGLFGRFMPFVDHEFRSIYLSYERAAAAYRKYTQLTDSGFISPWHAANIRRRTVEELQQALGRVALHLGVRRYEATQACGRGEWGAVSSYIASFRELYDRCVSPKQAIVTLATVALLFGGLISTSQS
ncbi:MAG: hypothetical protein HYW02_02255 [Deltaproteobacteria bacterium]|nr:hypothetical protein [Deltaproteobacteria bacterium]